SNMQGTQSSTLELGTFGNSGLFVASNTAGKNSTITMSGGTNYGTIQSKGSLALNITTSFENMGSSAKILADDDLTILARQQWTKMVLFNDTGSTMQAGDVLSIAGNTVGGFGYDPEIYNHGLISGDKLDVY